MYDYKIKSLNIILPKTSAYTNSYDGQTKWMYFLIENNDSLNKYNTIWNKVGADIKQEFNSEPKHNNSFF